MGCGDPHSRSTIGYTSNLVGILSVLLNFVFCVISGCWTVVHSAFVAIQYLSWYFTINASNLINSNN